MPSPTLAERLGFEATDRVAIVHCDDIGMCRAANEGAFEALAKSPATCGSVMVPCPGFADAARSATAPSRSRAWPARACVRCATS